MKEYKVYGNPQGNNIAIKQGWSWPAFFFNCIWALIKKMWGLGIGVLFLVIVLMAIGSASIELALIAQMFIYIYFGVKGNKWRENSLLRRGYDHTGTVTAASPEGAIALQLKENIANNKA